MSDRKKFTWDVTIQREDGHVEDVKVHAYWSPEHELTEQSVLTAAATKATKETGKNHVGIKCELVSR